MGYSFGVSPIISYHYGSNNTIELKSLFKKSITIIMIFAIVLTFLAELSSGVLASIFVSYDLELLELTTLAIRIYSICYIIQGINIFSSSLFTALNNGLVSGILSFARTLVFQVAMVILLPMILGSIGIWLAISFAEGLGLLVSVYCIIKYSKTYHYL